MKLDKVQIEILKALVKNPERVGACYKDDGYVLVTTNGVTAYRIHEDDLRLNLDGTQTSTALLHLDGVRIGCPLAPTDLYRNAGTARQYLYGGDPERPIYIDTKLLAPFEQPQLYQREYNPKGICIVTEFDLRRGTEIVVGYIMPVKIRENEEE